MDDKYLTIESSSFRDPAGFIFYSNSKVFRQINNVYRKQYDHIISSGLYDSLQADGMIVTHKEVNEIAYIDFCYKVILPEVIPCISYPYEWSFGQLKDSAILTLKIHRHALDYGMVLKDASAYNIQFNLGRPILIDTLSFDFYEEGQPWGAYGQFCRHFLAPLFLMVYRDIRLSQLLRIYIDGIPLDLASKLLAGKGGFAATQHIRWHAAATKRYADAGKKGDANFKIRKISIAQHIALIDSLLRIVESLALKNVKTEWRDYNPFTSYTKIGVQSKMDIVKSMIDQVSPKVTWDFGANDGTYSKAALYCDESHVVAFDADPIAVERNYNDIKNKNEKRNLLPLLLDLANPSPNIGFANKERLSIDKRSRPDLIMLLAVLHHLVISNNLPLHSIASWLWGMTDFIIIEFVPKEDEQAKKLLETRVDIFENYTKNEFEKVFSKYFELLDCKNVEDSLRTLYLYRRKNAV